MEGGGGGRWGLRWRRGVGREGGGGGRVGWGEEGWRGEAEEGKKV